LFQLGDFLRELLLNILKLLLHVFQLVVQVVLLFLFLFVLRVKLLQSLFVVFLRSLQLFVLLFDEALLILNLLLLLRDVFVHRGSLLLLVVSVFFHVLNEVSLKLLDILNLNLLRFQHTLSLFQLLVLVSKAVDLGFELIWLLLFDHLDVTIGDLLNFREAGVGETVALQADVDQSCVLVQCLQHHSFD